MSDYRFEIGQRVTCGSSNCTVTHRYLSVNGHREYMVRWDGDNWEINRYESQLKPAQLRRGDVVQREQAGSIPRWAIVRSNNGHGATYRRSASGNWQSFGTSLPYDHESISWPVTVVDVPGDDE